MEGLKGGGGARAGHGVDDLLNMFMGGGGGARSNGTKQKKQVKPIAHSAEISLADAYNGKTLVVRINR